MIDHVYWIDSRALGFLISYLPWERQKENRKTLTLVAVLIVVPPSVSIPFLLFLCCQL